MWYTSLKPSLCTVLSIAEHLTAIQTCLFVGWGLGGGDEGAGVGVGDVVADFAFQNAGSKCYTFDD